MMVWISVFGYKNAHPRIMPGERVLASASFAYLDRSSYLTVFNLEGTCYEPKEAVSSPLIGNALIQQVDERRI